MDDRGIVLTLAWAGALLSTGMALGALVLVNQPIWAGIWLFAGLCQWAAWGAGRYERDPPPPPVSEDSA